MIYADEAGILPLQVRLWLGLRTPGGTYNSGAGVVGSALTEQNDIGKTFAQIADIIETEPEGLFA